MIVADRDGEGAQRAAAKLGAAAHGVRADVTVAADVKAMVEAAQQRFGSLDILVNNAGMGHVPQPLETLAEEDFDRILAVNVKAIYLAAKEVVPRFKAQKKGVILNVASTAGVSPRPRLTWYNASKGWAQSATRSMAVELAPFGIRVTWRSTRWPATPMLKTFARRGHAGDAAPGFLPPFRSGAFRPRKTSATRPAFSAATRASMITGVAMEVDGGRCIYDAAYGER